MTRATAKRKSPKTPPQGLFALPEVEGVLETVAALWPAILQKGAFVFDIDDTLLPPDDPVSNHPQLVRQLAGFLKAGLRMAVISGSPGAVVEHRLIRPLGKVLGSRSSGLRNLTAYVNGGSTKLLFRNGRYREDAGFSRRNRIPGEFVYALRSALAECVDERFGLPDTDFLEMCSIWRAKRDRQWGNAKVSFEDGWIGDEPWEILFWDDEDMARVKAGLKSARMSFPFINVRRPERDRHGRLRHVAGFTPSGFYMLQKQQGDPVTMDLRDHIIRYFKKELGPLAQELVMRKAGRSSIDITKKGADKAAALHDFIRMEKRDTPLVFYFGDEFYDGGNDQPIAEDEALRRAGLKILAFNTRTGPFPGMLWAGRGPLGVRVFLGTVAKFSQTS